MHLIELKTFQAIVETGSLVKASEKLNVTQSTVTARLKSLEDELGQKLINRQKSGATLTASGERLRRYADTISDLWHQAHQEISLPDAMSSVCNLACHPDLWHGLGSRLFEQIRKDLPKVAISVWHGSENDISGWLAGGLSDVAITYSQNASQTQSVTPIFTDKLVLVSTRKDTPLKFDQGYVFVEAGDDFGRKHAAHFADASAARISFGSAVLALEHIAREGGSAYLPERIAGQHPAGKDLLKVSGAPIFERTAFLVTNNSAREAWPWFDDIIEEIK